MGYTVGHPSDMRCAVSRIDRHACILRYLPSLFYLAINPATADSAVEILTAPPVATVVIAATGAPTAKAQAVPATAVGADRAVHVVDGTLRARNRR